MSSLRPSASSSDAGDFDLDDEVEWPGNLKDTNPDNSKSLPSIAEFAGQNYQRIPPPATGSNSAIKDPKVVHKVEGLSVADSIQKCTQQFSWILLLQSKERRVSTPSPTATDQVLSGVAESFDRYKIWSADTGTYKNGYSSLDYRLKDASNVSGQVISLLSELDESLRYVFEMISHDEGLWAQKTATDQTFEPDELRLQNLEELEPILADINHIVDCLCRLSSVIEDPAPHDQIVVTSTAEDTNTHSQDMQIVKTKHANIGDDLAERLVHAISQRRAYLGYRRAKYDNVQTVPVTRMSQPYMRTEAMSAKSSTQILTPNALEPSDPLPTWPEGMGQAIDEDILEPWVSNHPWAPTSTVIDTPEHLLPSIPSKADISKEALLLIGQMKNESEREYKSPRTLPGSVKYDESSSTLVGSEDWLLPDSGKSSLSLCPLCWTYVYIVDNAEWIKHILSDLRPYICIEANCRDSDKLYGSHQEWIQHVRHSHWMEWVCTAGCVVSFTQLADLVQHLRVQHADLADEHLDALIELSERPGSGFREIECPFCLEKLTTDMQYQQHVGQHQKRLASITLNWENFTWTYHRSKQSLRSTNLQDEGYMSKSSSQPSSSIYGSPRSYKLAERKRRTEMKDLFEQLRDLMPQERGSKASKWAILTKAISEHQKQADHIRNLSGHCHSAAQENELLRQELSRLNSENARLRASPKTPLNPPDIPPNDEGDSKVMAQAL